MAADGNIWSVAKGMHIHPALSEVVLKAFGKLKETEGGRWHCDADRKAVNPIRHGGGAFTIPAPPDLNP
jgi:hypothetical protein